MARARVDFQLDRRGIAEILKSPEMRDAINGQAVDIAARVRRDLPPDVEVQYRPYTTDRQAATVTSFGHGASDVEHRAAVIRAARSAGLEVREQSE